MAHIEDSDRPQQPVPGDETEDRRWVIRALVALLVITGFFIAIGRYDGTSSTTGQSSSAPAGPSAGSASLPKGPRN